MTEAEEPPFETSDKIPSLITFHRVSGCRFKKPGYRSFPAQPKR